jgi:hypothetical protein
MGTTPLSRGVDRGTLEFAPCAADVVQASLKIDQINTTLNVVFGIGMLITV